ncbi:unnamed protein product [Larinioides sclopetarius]|uniref:Aggregate spidroin 1 n=1 Tax=Larinioides sclopetarius TaxID=280406 RepID=A0AAV1ZDN0_9ARAC
MAFLGRSKKVDLQCLAEELGKTVTKDMKVVDLKKKILGSTEYEEEFVKELLERIVNEREEEIKRQNELETERNDEALERVNGEYLTEIQQKQLKDLLYRYKTLFSGRIKRAKVGEHVIRYSIYYTTSKEGTTTTPSGLITTPGGTTELPRTSYFGPTPLTTVPEKVTTPAVGTTTGQSGKTSPVIGTTRGERQTSPVIGTTRGERQTSPIFGTTTSKGQTTNAFGTTTSKVQTSPVLGTTPGTDVTFTSGIGKTDVLSGTTSGNGKGNTKPPKSQGISTPGTGTRLTFSPSVGEKFTTTPINIGTQIEGSSTPSNTYKFHLKIKHNPNGKEYLIIYIPGTNFYEQFDISFDDLKYYIIKFTGYEPKITKLPNGEFEITIYSPKGFKFTFPPGISTPTSINIENSDERSSTPSNTYKFHLKIKHNPNGKEYLIIYIPGTNFYEQFDISFDDLKYYIIKFTGYEPKITKLPNGELEITIYTPKGFKFTFPPGISTRPSINIGISKEVPSTSSDTFEFRVKTGHYSDGKDYIVLYIPGTNIHKQFSISLDDLIRFLIQFTGQQPQLIRLPNGDIKIMIARKRIPLFIRGPNGELIRIVEEMPGRTPGYITGPNNDIIQFLVPISNRTQTVKGPHGQNIELIRGNSQNTPGVVTDHNGYIIRVLLPDFLTKNTTTQGFRPITVEGPHGEQIMIVRESPGVTPGVVTHNDRILRIIIPKFSGEVPTYVTGPQGEIIYIIPGQNDTTPGAVTRSDGQLLYIILPQGFSHTSSTPGLVGPDIGLVNPGTTSPPSAQTGNPMIDIDTGFPSFNGTETNGTKGTGVEVIGDYGQLGPIPRNYSTPNPIYLFNTDLQPQFEIPKNYTLPPQYQNIAFEIFGDPKYNNTSPLLTLKQFENIFAVLLKNGSPRVKQLIQVIIKSRGNSPRSFDLRIFIQELSLEVKIKCELGHIKIKAAVFTNDPGKYVLGNKTAELFKKKTFLELEKVNDFVTRSQVKRSSKENLKRVEKIEQPKEMTQFETDEEILPQADEEYKKLIEVISKELIESQQQDLSPLLNQAKNENSSNPSDFKIKKNGMLLDTKMRNIQTACVGKNDSSPKSQENEGAEILSAESSPSGLEYSSVMDSPQISVDKPLFSEILTSTDLELNGYELVVSTFEFVDEDPTIEGQMGNTFYYNIPS